MVKYVAAIRMCDTGRQQREARPALHGLTGPNGSYRIHSRMTVKIGTNQPCEYLGLSQNLHGAAAVELVPEDVQQDAQQRDQHGPGYDLIGVLFQRVGASSSELRLRCFRHLEMSPKMNRLGLMRCYGPHATRKSSSRPDSMAPAGQRKLAKRCLTEVCELHFPCSLEGLVNRVAGSKKLLATPVSILLRCGRINPERAHRIACGIEEPSWPQPLSNNCPELPLIARSQSPRTTATSQASQLRGSESSR